MMLTRVQSAVPGRHDDVGEAMPHDRTNAMAAIESERHRNALFVWYSFSRLHSVDRTEELFARLPPSWMARCWRGVHDDCAQGGKDTRFGRLCVCEAERSHDDESVACRPTTTNARRVLKCSLLFDWCAFEALPWWCGGFYSFAERRASERTEPKLRSLRDTLGRTQHTSEQMLPAGSWTIC